MGIPNPPDELPYRIVGDLQVSASGQYRMLDLTIGWQGARGAQDIVLYLYDGAFDPQNPTVNRVAEFNRSFTNHVNDEEWVQLEPGRAYKVVLQMACDIRPGLGGFLMAGPGEITGVGVPTAPWSYGNFADVDTEVEFPGIERSFKWAGNHKYTAPATGYYYMIDGGAAWPDFGGVPAAPMAYSQPFDPNDPIANHLWGGIPATSFEFGLFLEKGQEIWWVFVDVWDEDEPETDYVYQTVLYTPGELAGVNRGITGSFSSQELDGQGILIEADDNFDFLFGALFTFEDGVTSATEDVGSTDHRWLTVYGNYSDDSTEVPLTWENSTGGRFNAAEPAAEQDSTYGTGKLVMRDCNTIELHYSLPDTSDGVFEFQRLWMGKSKLCYDMVNVAPPLP
jgi:hypothetical protein